MSINKVIISGNLTRDPELRQTSAGTAVLSFGIAVNERMKNSQTGEWEDRANFIDCTMWGKRAEAVSKYLAKGSKVCVEGKLRQSTWEKEGQKRSKVEVIVDELELMSRAEGASNTQYQQQPTAYTMQPQNARQNASQQPYQQQVQYQPQQQYQAVNYNQQQYMAPQGYQQQNFDAASAVYDEDIPF